MRLLITLLAIISLFSIATTETSSSLFIFKEECLQNHLKYIEYHKPITIKKHSLSLIAHNGGYFKNIPSSYVMELENASVLGNDGVIIIHDKIFIDSLWQWNHLFKSPRDIFPLSKPTIYNGRLAVGALNGSSNYYHWMTEILPRLYMLLNVKKEIPFDQIYLSYSNTPYQKETLALLGITQDNIIRAHATDHILPSKLIFPSQVAVSCLSPEWVINFLKYLCLKNYSLKNGKRRIFISRKKAELRKILNEDDITTFLDTYGFETILLENLSVVEQAQLFYESEWIIGIHGAGLTNLVFTRPGTHVIELFQEHLDETFFDLSFPLKLNYYPIKTHAVNDLSDTKMDIRFRNTTIDWLLLKSEIWEIFNKNKLIY